jgi:hypothetical protein
VLSWLIRLHFHIAILLLVLEIVVRTSDKLHYCDIVRTTSIGSPSAAAFFFSRAFTLAVVESTAVATFVIASFLVGLVELGYANNAGLAFETNSNLGV